MEAETLLAIPFQAGTQYFGMCKIGDFWYLKAQDVVTQLQKTLKDFFAEKTIGESAETYASFLQTTGKAGGKRNSMPIPDNNSRCSRSKSKGKTTIANTNPQRVTLNAPKPERSAGTHYKTMKKISQEEISSGIHGCHGRKVPTLYRPTVYRRLQRLRQRVDHSNPQIGQRLG